MQDALHHLILLWFLVVVLHRNVAEVIQHVESEGAEVMVATHNQQSIENAVALMKQLGLPPSSGVYFGQLLGMADHLSFTLGQNGYGVRPQYAGFPCICPSHQALCDVYVQR